MAFNQNPGRQSFSKTGHGVPGPLLQQSNAEVRAKAVSSGAQELRSQQASLNVKKQRGYTHDEKRQAERIVSRGSLDSGGDNYNFRTGEETVAPYEYSYVAPKNGTKGKVYNNKTNQVVSEANNSKSTNNTYSGSFKNPKVSLSDAQLYQSFVKDSVNDQTSKRKWGQVAKDYQSRG